MKTEASIPMSLRRKVTKRLAELNLPLDDQTTGAVLEMVFNSGTLIYDSKRKRFLVVPRHLAGWLWE
jgi:hypothetical protein